MFPYKSNTFFTLKDPHLSRKRCNMPILSSSDPFFNIGLLKFITCVISHFY